MPDTHTTLTIRKTVLLSCVFRLQYLRNSIIINSQPLSAKHIGAATAGLSFCAFAPERSKLCCAGAHGASVCARGGRGWALPKAARHDVPAGQTDRDPPGPHGRCVAFALNLRQTCGSARLLHSRHVLPALLLANEVRSSNARWHPNYALLAC